MLYMYQINLNRYSIQYPEIIKFKLKNSSTIFKISGIISDRLQCQEL